MAIRPLSVPPEVNNAGEAFELVRGWLIDNHLVCSLFPSAFENHAIWGVLLADIAHHIANALAESEGADRDAVLKTIAKAFNVRGNALANRRTHGRFRRTTRVGNCVPGWSFSTSALSSFRQRRFCLNLVGNLVSSGVASAV